VPLYEYRCEACGERSSALLPRYDSPDPACAHCGRRRLRRLVSTFATSRAEGSEGDHYGAEADAGDGDADSFDDDDW
jgi:putative FmdB family regulatory protein